MAFGIDDAVAIGGGIASGIGGALGDPNAQEGRYGAKTQHNISIQQILAQLAEWRRQQALTEGQAAQQTQNHMQQNPMRDMLQYSMMARMGVPQNSISYGAGANGPSGAPNVDRAAQFNARMGSYQPGMGGVSSAVDRQVLDNLGYGGTGSAPDMYHSSPKVGQQLNSNDFLNNYLSQMLGNKPESVGLSSNAPGAAPTIPNAQGQKTNYTGVPRQAMKPQSVRPMPRQGYAPGGY